MKRFHCLSSVRLLSIAASIIFIFDFSEVAEDNNPHVGVNNDKDEANNQPNDSKKKIIINQKLDTGIDDRDEKANCEYDAKNHPGQH